MDYLYIKDNIATEIIPEFDEALPGIPLNQRYSPDFLKNIFAIPQGVTVELGKLVDINTWTFTDPPIPEPMPEPEPEPVDIEILRSAKKQEISEACERTIHAGCDITTSIGEKHFNASDQDQTNFLAYRTEIIAAQSGLSSQVDLTQGIWYKADGEGESHRYWSVEDFSLIIDEIFKFKVTQLTYCDVLKSYVDTLDNAENIKAVYYGMKLE